MREVPLSGDAHRRPTRHYARVSKKDRPGITARELLAQLDADPVYKARKEAADAALAERTRVLREAEAPIVDDLGDAGVRVDSVWDLVNTSVPYPDALHVLLAHLQRGGYPDRVMESLARALAVKPAVAFWASLRAQYLRANGRGEEEGLAVALTACATPDQFGDLVELVRDDSRGDSRIHFLRAVKRVGGPGGANLLESLRQDKLFGQEAAALIGPTG